MPTTALACRYVLALRPLVPVRVMPEPETPVSRIRRQLALTRFPSPTARLNGRELQRRGPECGLVATRQQQLQNLSVVHSLNRFAVNVRYQVTGVQARLKRRTPGIDRLFDIEKQTG